MGREFAEPMNLAARALQAVDPAEVREAPHERTLDDLGTDLSQEGNLRLGCAAGRNQIVDEEHSRPGLDGTDVNLDTVAPVFEVEASGDLVAGKFPCLADRNEPTPEAVGHGGSEGEPTRFDATTTSIIVS